MSFFRKYLILILLTSCVTQVGEISSVHDDFSDMHHHNLFLGPVNSKITEVEASIIQVSDNQYYLNFVSLSRFDASGMKCPKLSKGNKFQFKDKNNHVYNYIIFKDPIITEKIVSLVSIGCKEEFEVGPFNKDFLLFIAKQDEMRFRAFGSRFNLDGKFSHKQLELLNKLQ